MLSVITLGATFAATARADSWDKVTKVSISEPIAVSGTILQPGTYMFKLVNLASDRHTVQILSEDSYHVFATINAINAERLEPTGKTVFTFYETPSGQPPAMKDWFYPGDNFGQEFINRNRPVQLSQVSQLVTPAPAPAPAPPPAVVSATEPAPEPPAPVIAQNEPPAAAPPAPAPAPEPAPVTESAPPVLPKTASDIPQLSLMGLLSLAAATGLRLVRKVG